jgi:caffeoyl-CoA O-methyltransferase
MIPPEIETYCINHSTQTGNTVRELGQYTKEKIHGSNMLIGELEASVLTFLIHFGKVKTILELGTYTGYSALAMAEQLPPDGKLTTVDINPHTTAIARQFWDKSPHGHKITQILKSGLKALEDLTDDFDLIFIDADKNNYSNYLEWALKHLSQNGLIVVDNTLWHGKVLSPEMDKKTDSIIAHNIMARDLEGFTKVLLPLRDGMFLITRSRPKID